MRIAMFKGSPHVHGSSNMLADEFARGAAEAGHAVESFDCAHAKLSPCQGCDACGMAGPCVQKDDGEKMKRLVLGSDMLVFVTPLYYFGMSAQLKTAIDRFYSFNGELASRHLRTALLAAAWDSNDWTMHALEEHYNTLVQYLGFRDMGMILGTGCGTPGMTKRTAFPAKAYALGASLR